MNEHPMHTIEIRRAKANSKKHTYGLVFALGSLKYVKGISSFPPQDNTSMSNNYIKDK